ncbi:MAG: accessory Sec system translocase SecA2 [Lactobacillus sp.]
MSLDRVEHFKLKRVLKKINRLAPKMRQMSDEQLKQETEILRGKLKSGKTVDAILPEAYAAMREADYRVLGMFPYDVQVMGAIVLNQGSIAEMKTGEGKTLTATMAMYLNALSGKGAMLVTTNEYLSKRDKEKLEPVYNWMGLTVSNGFDTKQDEDIEITPDVKRGWYASDILYTTASSLAFDYLFNNLASSKEQQFLRPFHYVVIDEVDEVLLDEAESPFVVSSSPALQSNLYGLADNFFNLLDPKIDFRIKENDQVVWLTYHGVKKAERYFRIDNLFATKYRELYRHIILAMRAHLFMRRGHDYVVLQDKVILLDETDGRLKQGVQVSTGLHQAVEAKEHVKITTIQKTAATIIFPSLFGLFDKVSGMSGTAKVNADEFLNIYNMKVVTIPTRKPVIRKDYSTRLFLTTSDKLGAALKQVIEYHDQGRPVLLVAGSVENSEIISELLLNYGIAHNVLNAFNAAREADIIKEAGQEGAVTVATNMAGRGTDIKLGPGVKEKGGLAVIGTEMLSDRVRLQLAGRAGRQGDPGSSQFFISLEDRYISKASTRRQRKYYRRKLRNRKQGKKISEIKNLIVKWGLYLLKERVESNGATSRMQTNNFAIALGMQRDIYYQLREKIINTRNLQPKVNQLIEDVINAYVHKEEKWNSEKVRSLIYTHFSYDQIDIPEGLNSKKKVKDFLEKVCAEILTEKKRILINDEQLNSFYHQVILSALDSCWIDEVDYVDKLRAYSLQWKFSGRDINFIHESQAFKAFKRMLEREKFTIVESLMLSPIYVNNEGKIIVKFI